MNRLAKLLARTAFGIGCAIGLVTNLSLTPLLEQAQAAIVRDDNSCTNPPSGMSAEQQYYLDVQCQVHAALFGDNTVAASVSFPFGNNKMSAPGTYTGRDYYGNAVKLAVIWSQPIKQTNSNTPPGAEAYAVEGTMTGPVGKCYVFGVECKGFTNEAGYFFVPCGIPSQADYNSLSMNQRILAGVRYVDRANGKSMSEAEAQAAGAHNPSATSTDLSNIYCDTTPGFQGIDYNCVNRAYAAYNQAIADANAVFQSCCEAAFAAFVVCVMFTFEMPIIGQIIFGLACLAAMCYWLKNCSDTYNQSINAAQAQLLRDLAACGVVIVQM